MNDRRGNPSDPAEEAERVRKAYQNLDDWGKRFGGFSGGVSMQMGDGKKYVVPIGDREIAQKVVSRPMPAKEEAKALPEPVATPNVPPSPKRSWFEWLFHSIFGDRL